MKIKPEDLTKLKAAVKPYDTAELRTYYLDNPRGNDRNMRFRWDLLRLSGLKIGDGKGMSGLPLYAYMNDDHIDTALRSFIPDLVGAKK